LTHDSAYHRFEPWRSKNCSCAVGMPYCAVVASMRCNLSPGGSRTLLGVLIPEQVLYRMKSPMAKICYLLLAIGHHLYVRHFNHI
jgi:hypothetical protein